MQNEGNAFDNDFRRCMLGQWENAGILDRLPAELCSYKSWFWTDYYSQLCYGLNAKRPTAQFISCYNTKALIPEFTAHIVPAGTWPANVPKPKKYTDWRKDNGPPKYAPKKQALAGDFGSNQQITDNPSWDNKNYFCSRGHLTPKGDFNSDDERDLTFIVTNAAPQWQKFNGYNWARMEEVVKDWAKANTKQLYVFTGTDIHTTEQLLLS
ncbi:neurogenic locus notch homolog 1-like [Paramuricea clavata]|nr:neurogenic locus notch homolog 1-like [Paramuricea clavata]